jgi:hypothetical protein
MFVSPMLDPTAGTCRPRAPGAILRERAYNRRART